MSRKRRAKRLDVADAIRIQAAAARVGKSPRAIRYAIERGELSVHRTIDGARLLAVREVDAWTPDSPGRKPQR